MELRRENGISEVERACAQERERVCCWLHDTALQTLELIASGALRDDPDARALMAMAADEATRLRSFVDRGGRLEPPGFAEAVRAIVGEARKLTDQTITLRFGPLGRPVASDEVAALGCALREALTNARKHAPGAAIAVYAEAGERGLLIRVRDRGPGCTAAPRPDRAGLRRSIGGRLAGLGGRVAIEAAPGAGTLLTMALA